MSHRGACRDSGRNAVPRAPGNGHNLCCGPVVPAGLYDYLIPEKELADAPGTVSDALCCTHLSGIFQSWQFLQVDRTFF